MLTSIAGFRSFENTVKEMLTVRREAIVRQYLDDLPEDLRKFVEGNISLFESLFEYGRYVPIYRRDEIHDFDLRTLRELEQLLLRLKKHWAGKIDINIRKEPGRLTVRYTPAESSEEPQDVDLRTAALFVQCVFGDRVMSGHIDPETSFMADVAQAVRQSKDPVDAIAYLADEGSRSADRSSVAWANRMGEPPHNR